MENIDANRKCWIRNNLGITQDRLTPEQAKDWLKLMYQDMEAFLVYGLYGYVNRLVKEGRIKGEEDLSHRQKLEFCAEFVAKIQLANRHMKLAVQLPLFDTVGKKVMTAVCFRQTERHPNIQTAVRR